MDFLSNQFLISFLISLVLLLFIEFTTSAQNRARTLDAFWGLGLAAITLYTFLFTSSFYPKQILMSSLALISFLRLAVYRYIMPRIGADEYYLNPKKRIIPFLKVCLTPAVLVWLVSFPEIIVNSGSDGAIGLLSLLGTFFWVIGYVFETLADYQMLQFKRDTLNLGKVLRNGLWKYSRHPNYFGQMLMAWGLWFFASEHFIALISPAVIYILIKWSAITRLEKKLEAEYPEYVSYKKKTNVLVPWFPDDHWD